jgi:formylglycine-generating enzyme required for sulfatase activity
MGKVVIFVATFLIMDDSTTNVNSQSMLPVGTLLQGGKYRIERHLASGGFGKTYVVTNTYFDETCAMKEFFMKDLNLRAQNEVTISMLDKRPFFEAHLHKFIKEAYRLRKLHNEHLVSVLDLFEENGTAYYLMDFIEGESLKARLNRQGHPMTEAEVMPILRQALDVLEVVHREQIWHLDIKPDNMMVDRSGRLYLIDFGASKQLHTIDGRTLPTSSAFALTPGYAPLEQMEQNLRFCGPWTDLYALGATLYKLLTLQAIPTPQELLYGTQLTFPPTVSSKMQQLITWMMKPLYNQRPQSVAEVRAFLGGNTTNDETIVGIPADDPKEETRPMLDEPNVETITVNGVSFKMIRVEGGTFWMGSDEEDAYDDEKPVHQVTLSTFSIGEAEVTQELWQAVMGTNPSHFKGPKHPVENVSWYDCQSFIRKLNSLMGRNFRLPTEAEWEYAARGGKKSKGYKYAGSNDIDEVAWYDDNSGSQMHDVATKRANELGLYDMSGNFWEWCQDWYSDYSSGSQTNPKGPSSGSRRVFRGGSWCSRARLCRVSYRDDCSPSGRSSSLGLRLAF